MKTEIKWRQNENKPKLKDFSLLEQSYKWCLIKAVLHIEIETAVIIMKECEDRKSSESAKEMESK